MPEQKQFTNKNETKFQSGWKIIGGKRCYFRSSWEKNYAYWLQWLKAHGQIKDWSYEPKTFWFEKIKRGVRSYKPDFEVAENNGNVSYHEIKGFMDSKSRTKIKRMHIYFPDVKLIVIDAKAYRSLNKQIQLLIKTME